MVLKIPDGSFSRGVAKVADRAELERMVRGMLEDSDLILAQEFMYTEYDWRVGVLDGEPLFVSQYMMARKHWQIVRHTEGGRPIEGGYRTMAVAAAPREIVDTGVRAARLIGRGLYGVDIKTNERGVFVIEVNDNPNLVHDVEDAAERDEVWRRLAGWFLKRLQREEPVLSRARGGQGGVRARPAPPPAPAAAAPRAAGPPPRPAGGRRRWPAPAPRWSASGSRPAPMNSGRQILRHADAEAHRQRHQDRPAQQRQAHPPERCAGERPSEPAGGELARVEGEVGLAQHQHDVGQHEDEVRPDQADQGRVQAQPDEQHLQPEQEADLRHQQRQVGQRQDAGLGRGAGARLVLQAGEHGDERRDRRGERRRPPAC